MRCLRRDVRVVNWCERAVPWEGGVNEIAYILSVGYGGAEEGIYLDTLDIHRNSNRQAMG